MFLSKSAKLAVLLCLVLFLINITFFQQIQPRKIRLRDRYVAVLLSYEGMNYAPYGEEEGISCSTLVRKALINTFEIDGDKNIKIQNYPCTSEELRKGCHGELSSVFNAENLKGIDYNQLQPGDIAILGNSIGIHTMAYIGNESWIHADPITQKVVKTKATDINDDWSMFNVRVMRWNLLKN
jgi:hypothetical protein